MSEIKDIPDVQRFCGWLRQYFKLVSGNITLDDLYQAGILAYLEGGDLKHMMNAASLDYRNQVKLQDVAKMKTAAHQEFIEDYHDPILPAEQSWLERQEAATYLRQLPWIEKEIIGRRMTGYGVNLTVISQDLHLPEPLIRETVVQMEANAELVDHLRTHGQRVSEMPRYRRQSRKVESRAVRHRRRLRRMGLCRCGRLPEGGYAYCGRCRASYVRANKAYRRRRQEAGLPVHSRHTMKARYDRLKEQAICVRCGRLPVVAGRVQCSGCLRSLRERERRRRRSRKEEQVSWDS